VVAAGAGGAWYWRQTGDGTGAGGSTPDEPPAGGGDTPAATPGTDSGTSGTDDSTDETAERRSTTTSDTIEAADKPVDALNPADAANLVEQLEGDDPSVVGEAADAVTTIAAERPELFVEAGVVEELRDLRFAEDLEASRAAGEAVRQLEEAGLD
jgi:hypothetical protein